MTPKQREENEPLRTMDAKAWTDEFLRLNPESKTGLDFGTMIGWFANAIMTGHDHARWKLEPRIAELEKEGEELKKASATIKMFFESESEIRRKNEVLTSALTKAREALDGLLDGLSANYDPERCGLDSKTWDKRVEIAEKASEEIDKVLGHDSVPKV